MRFIYFFKKIFFFFFFLLWLVEINLRWNVAPGRFPRATATRRAPTPNQNNKTVSIKSHRRNGPGYKERPAGLLRNCFVLFFLKVLGSLLRLGPKSGGKYCRAQQESGVASPPACLGFCFQRPTASPGKTAFLSFPPKVSFFFGGGRDCEVKTILSEISLLCYPGTVWQAVQGTVRSVFCYLSVAMTYVLKWKCFLFFFIIIIFFLAEGCFSCVVMPVLFKKRVPCV